MPLSHLPRILLSHLPRTLLSRLPRILRMPLSRLPRTLLSRLPRILLSHLPRILRMPLSRLPRTAHRRTPVQTPASPRRCTRQTPRHRWSRRRCTPRQCPYRHPPHCPALSGHPRNNRPYIHPCIWLSLFRFYSCRVLPPFSFSSSCPCRPASSFSRQQTPGSATAPDAAKVREDSRRLYYTII